MSRDIEYSEFYDCCATVLSYCFSINQRGTIIQVLCDDRYLIKSDDHETTVTIIHTVVNTGDVLGTAATRLTNTQIRQILHGEGCQRYVSNDPGILKAIF